MDSPRGRIRCITGNQWGPSQLEWAGERILLAGVNSAIGVEGSRPRLVVAPGQREEPSFPPSSCAREGRL